LVSKEELISLAAGFVTGLVTLEMLEEELEHDEIDAVLEIASTHPMYQRQT
jgi:hypothetical protein